MRSVDRLYLTDIYIKMAMAAGASAPGSMAGGMGKVTGALGGGLMKGIGSMRAMTNPATPGMGGMGVAKALGRNSGKGGSLTTGFKNTATPGTPGPLAAGRPTVSIQPKARPVTQQAPQQQVAPQPVQPASPTFQNTAAAVQQPVQNPMAQPGMLRPMPATY